MYRLAVALPMIILFSIANAIDCLCH